MREWWSQTVVVVCSVAGGLCEDGGTDLSEGRWLWDGGMGGDDGNNCMGCG